MIAVLKCAACGLEREIEIARPPQFGFEVAAFAQDVGWHGVFDMQRSRAVVFCTDRCLNANLTRTGGIRARLRQPVAESSNG